MNRSTDPNLGRLLAFGRLNPTRLSLPVRRLVLTGVMLVLIGLGAARAANPLEFSFTVDGAGHYSETITVAKVLLEESGYDPESRVSGHSAIGEVREGPYRKVIVIALIPGRRAGAFKLGDFKQFFEKDRAPVTDAKMRIVVKPDPARYPRPVVAEEFNSVSGELVTVVAGDRVLVRFNGVFEREGEEPEKAVIKGLITFTARSRE